MYALVQDGSITKYLSGNRGVTIGGIQYPQNIFWILDISNSNTFIAIKVFYN